MTRLLLAAAVLLGQGAAFGAAATSTHAAEPLVPTVGPTPWWAGRLLILIGIMFVAAIVAGFVWHPQAEPDPVASADDHHASEGTGHH